ncbi:collagen alpha-1(I) chain-like [Ovis aries]|uniref:collagen alpha-1(I) chain-like n=1 Tax=Ovis aries TaxID=9940 RepID=UPI001C2E98C1|nr:collagen alpha-1(I) chain-like [Ovis aries]
MPDRATRPRVREGRGAPPPPRGRHEGEGRGGAAGGGGRRATLLSPSSTPPGPGHHDGDGRRAPSASIRPPTPERGGGGRAARTRRPARGGGRDRGPVPRSGERIGAGAPPRPARDDGGGGGGDDTGDGSGPRRAREARHTGAHGPGEQQTARGPRRTDGRRGAPTGCGRAGPTPRNRWRRWGGRAPPRGERPKATRRRGRESAAGAHRGISPPEALPAQGRSRGTTRDDDGLAPPPSRGSRPPPPPPPEPQASEGTAPPGDATGPAEAGDDTHVRRGEAGSGPGRGRERGRSHARDEGEDEAGGGGEGPASTHGGGRGTGTRAPPRGPDDKGRARGRAPRNTSAGSHRHPHARAVPRRLGRRPAPAIPGARDIPGTTLSSEAARTVTARRHQLRLRRRGRARRALLTTSWRGRGSRGRPGVAPRHSPPSPRAHTTGAGRTHTAPHLPDARRGPAGPSPDAEGGGAGRVATVATAHSGGAAAGGSGLIHQGLHDEGNRHASPYRLDPPKKRATLGTHTPPWRGPKGDTGLRETTPPLGLRHLRDDLERSRGTTEGHTRHAHTPAWGAQRGGGGTALPATGRAARRAHAEKAKREQSAASEDQRRPLTPRGKGQQETEDQGRRPHTQPLPSSPSLMGSGGKTSEGPPRTDREERTRSLGTPVPRLARLRLGPGEHDHTTSIRGAKARAANDPKRRTPDTEPTGRGSSQPPPGAHSGGEGRPG